MPQSVLSVRNLSKTFGTFQAVKDVSFDLEQGKIVGFLGPNGAGKTTTIQMLLGLLIPTSGSVTYFGKDLFTNREEVLEKINFSSTYISMPWRISVQECLHYTSYFYNIDDRKGRIKEIVDIFKLDKLRNKKVSQLSEGQKTRLMLAKGFINKPEVLLLDEPTASMDPETAQYIRDFILDYRNNNNISILFTSHNMSEIEEICDDIIFLKDGEVIAHDTAYNLAGQVKTSHISLLVMDGLKRITAMCENQKLPYRLRHRFIEIDVKENQIHHFLKELLDQKIEYQQISIEKPDLHDFFLEVAKDSAKTPVQHETA